MNRYFPEEPTPDKLPSKTMIVANNSRILDLMNYRKSHKIAVEILTNRLKFLVKNLSKPIIIFQELLIYFKQKRVILPEYTVIQNDGNKRIGCFIFLLYLRTQNIAIKLNDNGLLALALLVAESEPSQKDILIKLIINILTEGNF